MTGALSGRDRGVCHAFARGSAIVLIAAAGCGREGKPVREPAVLLPIQVTADTGHTVPLAVPPAAEARAWLQSVSTTPPPAARATPRAAPLALPPPDAAPQPPEISHELAEGLVVDDDLKPPIPIGITALTLPRNSERALAIELDVRVDESGAVSDALWAGGSQDSAAVAAVTTCALAMRFHPALQRGNPIAVWCRQRFEFGRSGVRLAPAAGSR